MSHESVEIVRRYYAALDSVLERYWAAPEGPFSESPLVEQLLVPLDPEVEWRALHREEPYRGHEEALRGVEEWLEAGDEWRVETEEVTEAGEGRVLAVHHVSITGRGSRIPIDQRIFTVVTVSDGKIRAISDYTERRDALAAAGLPEQER
jgi:ketosteroid isomerase-like protein